MKFLEKKIDKNIPKFLVPRAMSDAIRHVLTLYRVIYSILLTEHLTSKNYDENFRKNNSTK